MTLSRHFAALITCLSFVLLPAAQAEEPLKPGAKLDSLTVGKITYHDIVIRSINARTVMITHPGGMASVRLRDLAPEWQTRFNYDPAAEAATEKAAASTPLPAPPKRIIKPPVASGSDLDRVLQQFGQPATVQKDVNLRPQFIALGLGVRNQGRRPSCAIYAIVSALEFQNARICGQPENFSEDYLIWATERTVQHASIQAPSSPEGSTDDADTGFTLTEVVNALRAYGIPLQSSMPNNAALNMRSIQPPSPETIREAREHQRVFVHELPGRDATTRINNLVHALNAGIPVAVGLAWPNYHSLRTGYLSGQRPMNNAWHAVTIVGYHSETGRLEDTYFVFKNSWGDTWGQNGYGTVTFGYLSHYLNDAVLLEVQRS